MPAHHRDVPLKRYKKDFTHSYTFGVFTTLELLQHRPDWVLKVLAHSRGAQNEGVAKIRALCAAHGIPVEDADPTVERLSKRGDTYAVGVFRKAATPLSPAASHVVLVNPADRGNLGTIIRTMLAFGLRDLAVIPPAADRFDPDTVRASMGALFQARTAEFSTFEAYRASFASHALYPLMTDGGTPLAEAWFDAPFALVFGSESAGLPAAYHRAGTSVRIPTLDTVDSLNLSVAVGITLYAATQPRFGG